MPSLLPGVGTKPNETVAYALARARREVVLAVQVFRNRAAAHVLLRLLRRGVAVYVLADPEGLKDEDGYLAGLALAGGQVRLARMPARYAVAVIDGAVVVRGPALAGLGGNAEVLNDHSLARALRTSILTVWRGAPRP